MRPGVSSNVADLLKRMQQRKAAVERELALGARELAPILEREAKEILTRRIYSVQVPKRPVSGKPAWKRTGDIRRQERWRAKGVMVLGVNPSGHAIPRYRLGTAAGREIRSAGVQSVQWQEEALLNKRDVILKVRRKHVLKALQP